MPSLRNRARLERTALPLHPDRSPYFVKVPLRPGQAPGWYWQPAGASHPEYLGHNQYAAESALLELRAQLEDIPA